MDQRQEGSDPETHGRLSQGSPGPDQRVAVELSRRDFLLYNWALAFERPMVPFFLYTFVAMSLASMLGVWPAGRTYALAVLVPMLGYGLWVWISARSLWQRFPQLRQPRTYRFGSDALRVKAADSDASVPYRSLERVLETRSAFYLLRSDGSAEILPKRALADPEAFRRLLSSRIGTIKHSAFL